MNDVPKASAEQEKQELRPTSLPCWMERSGREGRGTINFGLGRLPHRRATPTLLPSATSLEPRSDPTHAAIAGSARMQVLGFKDGPGLRVLARACCVLISRLAVVSG